MKKIILKNHSSFIIMFLLLTCFFSFSGCATFGTFANLEKNQSTTEDVRKLLGEPAKIITGNDFDTWEYIFSEPPKFRNMNRKNKTLITRITFKNDIMTGYNISVVTKRVSEIKQPKLTNGRRIRPIIQGLSPKAHRFLKKFDTNKDGKITMKEYFGPYPLFNRIDVNHDHIIGIVELKTFFP